MAETIAKKCRRCKLEKPIDEFWKDKKRTDGIGCYCKICNNAVHKLTRMKHPETSRREHLKRYHGMTLDEYKEKLIKQRGVCAICGNPETVVRYGKLQQLQVDHNHKTGLRRGLLCSLCNMRLGTLIEKAEPSSRVKDFMLKAIAYLNYWKAD